MTVKQQLLKELDVFIKHLKDTKRGDLAHYVENVIKRRVEEIKEKI